MKFNLEKTLSSAKSAGAVAVGFVVGNVAKNLLMVPKEGKEKGIIPDNIGTNLLVAALSLFGAANVSNSFGQLVLVSVAAFFAIRTINKSTAKLSGLGDTTANKIARWINQAVPQLGNTSPDFSDNSEIQRIMETASYSPNYTESVPAVMAGDGVPRVLTGSGVMV